MKRVEKVIWLDDGKRKKINSHDYVWHSDLLVIYNDNTNEVIRIELCGYPVMRRAIRRVRYKTFFDIKQFKGMTEKQIKKSLIKISKEWKSLQEKESILEKEERDRIDKQYMERLKRREAYEKYVNELLKKERNKIKNKDES
jgi:hypothetical protein